MKLVTNHWGWSPRGIWTWLRFGWAHPVDVWGVHEKTLCSGKVWVYQRRVKVGPLCFAAGQYVRWLEPES